MGEIMDIIIPVGILSAIAVVCAVVLTLSDKFFGIKEDEQFIAVRNALPSVNCGACGYSGCDAYAKALADGKITTTNLCVPGGDKAASEIAEILGVEAEDVVEKVAYVACDGNCGATERRYLYDGVKSCRVANLNYSGDKLCAYACLGYGDCVRICPEDAISIENGVARVDPKKCIGCGMCTRECPHNIIRLIKDTERVVVECSNHDKGAVVRKICKNGCIACGKCEKTCPHDAIKLINNLATIDYDKCTACGECVKVCPVNCIHEGNFRCGAHF